MSIDEALELLLDLKNDAGGSAEVGCWRTHKDGFDHHYDNLSGFFVDTHDGYRLYSYNTIKPPETVT